MDDHKLIEGVLAGKTDSTRTLVVSYQPVLLRLANALVGDVMAEGVLQEAWIAIFKGLPQFKEQSSLKTWMTRILINKGKDRLRHEKVQGRALNFSEHSLLDDKIDARFDDKGHWRKPPIAWSDEGPEAYLQSEELLRIIDAGFGALPPLQQTVLVMRDIELLSVAEISNILDLSTSNIRVILHRAHSRLYSIVEDYQKTGELE